MCLARCGVGGEGWVDERIGFGLNQSCGNMGSVVSVSVLELQWRVGMGHGTGSGRMGWCYVCVSCEYRLCV